MSFLDVDLEPLRLRAALERRPIVLVRGAAHPRRVPRDAPVVLPHGRIVRMADAEAAGLADDALVELVPPARKKTATKKNKTEKTDKRPGRPGRPKNQRPAKADPTSQPAPTTSP